MTHKEKQEALRAFRHEIMNECHTKKQAEELSQRLNAFCNTNGIDDAFRLKELDGAGEALWMKRNAPDDE